MSFSRQPVHLAVSSAHRAKRAELLAVKDTRRPRVYDLRHRFATRSLEALDATEDPTRHMLALATYLGHVDPVSTHWYLEASPVLLRDIAEATERNKPFSEWADVFSSAACVVTLVDRLIHRSEIVQLDGESYRLREAKEQAARRSKARSRRSAKPPCIATREVRPQTAAS